MMHQNEKKKTSTTKNTLREQLLKPRRKRKKTSKMSSRSVIEPKINEDRVVQWYKFIAERHRVYVSMVTDGIFFRVALLNMYIYLQQ